MKKLILVTLLAVSASWLLSEAGQQPAAERAPRVAKHERPRHPDGGRNIVRVDDPAPPKGEKGRAKRATAAPVVKVAPSWFPKTEADEQDRLKTDAFGSRVLVGQISVSEDRAQDDLRKLVRQQVTEWLSADVDPSWPIPGRELDHMVQGAYVQEVTHKLTSGDPTVTTPEALGLDGLYTMYRAGQQLDFSPDRRAQILRVYRQELAKRRLQRLGGGMALALVGLAVLSGYIKADEATKGYYTNRLRLASAAGLGVAGVAVYRFLS